MEKLLTVTTDAAETSVIVLPFGEDIENVAEYDNPLLKRFYQNILDLIAQQPSLIERPSLLQTGEGAWIEYCPPSREYALIDRWLDWLQHFYLKRDVTTKRRVVSRVKKPIPWLESVVRKIDDLASLSLNWDSYGSSPPGVEECQYAKSILSLIEQDNFPVPDIVPVSGGGIQLEWQYQGRALELEIVANSGSVNFLKIHEDGTAEEDSYPITAREITQGLLRWLFIG